MTYVDEWHHRLMWEVRWKAVEKVGYILVSTANAEKRDQNGEVSQGCPLKIPSRGWATAIGRPLNIRLEPVASPRQALLFLRARPRNQSDGMQRRNTT